MNIYQKREAVKGAFPNSKWAHRVDAMPDNQIIAVYHNLREQKKV